jgi:D-xylose transport system ATP-binding protein
MSILEVRDITKDFPGIRALDEVSFDVREGEIHALVGENGAGKSTLIKILGGVYPANQYSGEILLNGHVVRFHSVRDAAKAGIALIHQEQMLVKHLTVAENIFLGDEPTRFGFVDWNGMINSARQLADEFHIDVDVRTELAHLGMAKQQIIEIVKALRKTSTILILDEPTSALAKHEAEQLFSILRNQKARGTAIIYISHRLEEVFGLADRITVLRDGKLAGSGLVPEWTRETLVKAMVGRELREVYPVTRSHTGAVALEVQHLSVADPEIKGRKILEDISFSVCEGEVLGIAGLMGAGRTEILSTLFGKPPGIVCGGQICIDGNPVQMSSPEDAIKYGLAFIPEDRMNLGLVLDLSVVGNLSLVHLKQFCKFGFIDNIEEFQKCSGLFGRLGIRSHSMDMRVGSLSGGNQQKVVFGKWLLRKPKLLLLDEPTRGVDIGAKVEIHNIINDLKREGVAIIIVSSELPEVLEMSDRIIVLRRGRVAGEFPRSQATQEGIMELAA